MQNKRLRPHMLVVCALLASAVIIPAHLKSAAAATRGKMNVLFVTSDDMNNHLGCYGYPAVQTPWIDRLAQRGMRFDRAYCQVPICNPSRVSYLSGFRPDKTRVHTLSTPTRQYLGDAVMLPEFFRQHGYFTAQVGKIFHTGDEHEDPRSWDVEYREFGKRPPEDQVLRGGEPAGPIKHTIDWAVLKTADADTPDGIVARRAAQLLERAARDDKPFFLGVGFRRPHAPFAAPKEYFDLYPIDSITLPAAPPKGHFAQLLPAAHNYAPPPKPLSAQEQRELIAAYYACNSFVDAQLGVLMASLDRLDLWDNTIVIFFGDHGYHLGEHGGLWHKNSLFEESARVPLVVYAPGMRAGGHSCRRLVELIDLYPTLTALCGLPTSEDLDGTSFEPLLDDPKLEWKQAAYSSIARTHDPAERVREVEFFGRSVRTDRWRYTEWDAGKEGIELYDHEHDPLELKNLAKDPQHVVIVEQLRELLESESKVR